MNVASLSGGFVGGGGGGWEGLDPPPPYFLCPTPCLLIPHLLLSPPSNSVLEPPLASFASPLLLVNTFRMQAQKGTIDTQEWDLGHVSLVLRPSHCPVFDGLAYYVSAYRVFACRKCKLKTGRWEGLGMRLRSCI